MLSQKEIEEVSEMSDSVIDLKNTVNAQTIDWHMRATLLELLAFSFIYPTKDTIQPLVSGEYQEAIKEIISLAGISLPEEELNSLSQYKGQENDALLHALRKEATRLFLGIPEPLISPHEGIWRAKDDGTEPLLFINPHSMAVERFMKDYGLGQAEGKNEPLDYVATELEFLEYLAGLEAGIVTPNPQRNTTDEGWAEAYELFLEEHSQTWMPRFSEAVISQAREPYYRVSALLLKEFLSNKIMQ